VDKSSRARACGDDGRVFLVAWIRSARAATSSRAHARACARTAGRASRTRTSTERANALDVLYARLSFLR
jgi:hypothetical protein